MKKLSFPVFLIITISLLISSPIFGKNKIKYEKFKSDPVLKKIVKKREKRAEDQNKITDEIIKRNKKIKKDKKENRMELKTDLSGVYPPGSINKFRSFFHFPPVAQYYTSTCWSFSSTSYFESETFRITGRKVKLSEMWTVYYELLEKSRRYIKERGYSAVSGGGESNGLIRIWRKYGIVPLNIYSGMVQKDEKYDHIPLMKELRSYLEYIKTNNLWDEENNLKQIIIILDKYMGKPPSEFKYEGKTYTPKSFLADFTGLKMDDYFSVMSTKYYPFYTKQEFKVPDNWWHNKDYLNLPLRVWYNIIKRSINNGYTVCIGGDVSEPGKLGSRDIAFIPSFDIPEKFIDQDSREYRIFNKTTDDDHGIHIVGFTRYKGKDWFLIKDSGRSARHGKLKGYYFFRGDFIKLKMLTFTIHKDMLKNILGKIK